MELNKEEILEVLKGGEATVMFTKVDGTLRGLHCTLDMRLIPPTPPMGPMRVKKKLSEDVIRVWSIGDEAWRSFRTDSVIIVVKLYK